MFGVLVDLISSNPLHYNINLTRKESFNFDQAWYIFLLQMIKWFLQLLKCIFHLWLKLVGIQELSVLTCQLILFEIFYYGRLLHIFIFCFYLVPQIICRRIHGWICQFFNSIFQTGFVTNSLRPFISLFGILSINHDRFRITIVW